MQAACGIDNHHIGIVGYCRRQCVVGYCCGIGAKLLFHHGHSGAAAPLVELLYGGGSECIGCAEHHFLARGLEMSREFADGCGFAHTVHTNYHNDIWLAA